MKKLQLILPKLGKQPTYNIDDNMNTIVNHIQAFSINNTQTKTIKQIQTYIPNTKNKAKT